MSTYEQGGAYASKHHELVNPPSMAPAVGFAHGVVSAPGRVVHLGGQTAQTPDGSIVDASLVGQFDRAAANLVEVLDACGACPGHLTQLTIYTTDMAAYRASLSGLGRAYRRHLGKHYPAMALLGVTALFDPAAMVELVGVAVIPERPGT